MKRVEYVDTAKGYLMLLVVIGHVLIVLNPEYNKLYYTPEKEKRKCNFTIVKHLRLYIMYNLRKISSQFLWQNQREISSPGRTSRADFTVKALALSSS